MLHKIVLGHHIKGCILRLAMVLELNNNDSKVIFFESKLCEKLILFLHG